MRVADDVVRNAISRASWTPTQRKTTAGYARFCEAIYGLKDNLKSIPAVSYVSTASQEASNLFLWQIGSSLTLRVKSEPSELSAEATEPLFARQSSDADETVCLSWEITSRQTIRDAHFASVHDRYPWRISLAELLAAFGDEDGDTPSGPRLVPLRPRRPGGPGVSSNRPRRENEDTHDAPTD